MRVHFLAMGDTGWGELTLGLRVAEDARREGHTCRFTAPSMLAQHVAAHGFPVETDEDLRGPAFLERLERWTDGADRCVLVDLRLAGAALYRRGVHPQQLIERLPVGGVDTWHFRELGGHIDYAPGTRIPVELVWRDLPRRVVPVPFARPEADRAANLLPTSEVSPAARAARREELGARGLIVVCTSYWQHRFEGRTALPEILGLYLSRLDSDVLHIGPEDLPWSGLLGSRYARAGSMPRDRFEATLAAADLVVSPNPSATSNTTAIALGTPVLTVWSRWSATGRELAFRLGYRPSEPLDDLVARHHPIQTGALWPLDWLEVMRTLLAGNPYAELLNLVDLLDERAFEREATGLLRDPERRARFEAMRCSYLDRVASLPGPWAALEHLTVAGRMR